MRGSWERLFGASCGWYKQEQCTLVHVELAPADPQVTTPLPFASCPNSPNAQIKSHAPAGFSFEIYEELEAENVYCNVVMASNS